MDYLIVSINLLFALLMLTFVLYLGFVFWSFRKVVPYVPTPFKIIDKMIELAQMKKGDKIIDLGSGSGRIVLRAAKQLQGEVWGVENSKILLLVSNIRKAFNRKKAKVKFVRGDIFKSALEPYDIIFCFLTTKGMKQLEKSFAQLRPGSKIISYMFSLKNKENFREQVVKLGKKYKIFIYQKI